MCMKQKEHRKNGRFCGSHCWAWPCRAEDGHGLAGAFDSTISDLRRKNSGVNDGALSSHRKIERNRNPECKICTALKTCIDRIVPNFCSSSLFFFARFLYSTQTQHIRSQCLRDMGFCSITSFLASCFGHHRIPPLWQRKLPAALSLQTKSLLPFPTPRFV